MSHSSSKSSPSSSSALLTWVSDQVEYLQGYKDDDYQMSKYLLSSISSTDAHTKTTEAQMKETAFGFFLDDPKNTQKKKLIEDFIHQLWQKTHTANNNNTTTTPSASSTKQHKSNHEEMKAPQTKNNATTVTSSPLKSKSSSSTHSTSNSTSTSGSSSSSSGVTSAAEEEADMYMLKSSTKSTPAETGYADFQRGRNLKVKYVKSSRQSNGKKKLRTICNCMAKKDSAGDGHKLFANCTACGRIICEIEGEGPCFYCGSMVMSEGTVINELFLRWMHGEDVSESLNNATSTSSTSTSTSTSSGSNAPNYLDDEEEGQEGVPVMMLQDRTGARVERKRREAAALARKQRGEGQPEGAMADEGEAQGEGEGEGGEGQPASLKQPAPTSSTKASTTSPQPNTNSETTSTRIPELDASVAEGLAKAEAHKNKLLRFAAEQTSRSQIYDEQSDYYDYEGNQWMSEEEKKQKAVIAKQQMEALNKRRDHTVSIDLMSGKVQSHNSDPYAYSKDVEDEEKKTSWVSSSSTQGKASASSSSSTSDAGSRAARTAAFAPALINQVEEMRIVSRSQYYRNDTLTGRAKQVYDALLQSMKEEKLKQQSANNGSNKDSQSSDKTGPEKLRKSFKSRVQHDDEYNGTYEDNQVQNELDQEERQLEMKQKQEEEERKQKELEEKQDKDSYNDEPLCSAAGRKEQALSQSITCKPTAAGSSSLTTSLYPDSSDTGMCLSLHQPWASLVVLGIKRYEGRGWSTPYRGRLWIASTVHQATPEEIKELEDEYRQVYGEKANIPFPKEYPPSALLGCIDLVDVKDQNSFQQHRIDQLKKSIAIEDSMSGFVFCCENPRTLLLPQRISGQHKLYKLPTQLVQNLQKALKPVPEKWRPGANQHQAQDKQVVVVLGKKKK